MLIELDKHIFKEIKQVPTVLQSSYATEGTYPSLNNVIVFQKWYFNDPLVALPLKIYSGSNYGFLGLISADNEFINAKKGVNQVGYSVQVRLWILARF